MEFFKSKPGIFPANGHDICNYLARYGMSNFQIQAVLNLNGRLDYNRLIRAARLLVDIEPIFGCRFVENERPYWKSIEDIDSVEFCSYSEVEDVEKEVRKFTESPMDMDFDPMVKLKLIRSWANDTLCLKINHACCDGTGMKEYIKLLSDIYSVAKVDANCYLPEPRIAGRKDQDKLFNSMRISPNTDWNPLQDAPKMPWPFHWNSCASNDISYVLCRMQEKQLSKMKKYGKKYGATINDLLITAYYRALFEYSKVPYGLPMDISSTIDLRCYLPNKKTEAIRNFSGGFTTRIARVLDESFEGTLYRVIYAMKRIKEGNPGIQNALGGEKVEKMNFLKFKELIMASSHLSKGMYNGMGLSSGLCIPGFSNLGIISDSVIRFGKIPVTDAYFVPPAISVPGFLLLASTYNGILSLTASYYKNTLEKTDVECLLESIKRELIEGCIL